MGRGHRTAATFAVIGTTLTTALAVLLAPAPAGAATYRVDPATLPAGAAPALPYLDRRAGVIVDGARRVGVAGLQGTVVRLWKVDGGYLLGRSVTGGQDLVLVRTDGSRRVFAPRWLGPGAWSFDDRLAVSQDGSRVAFNTSSTSSRYDYAGTEVRTLPGGSLVRRRTFDSWPLLSAYGTDRVLVSVYPDTSWWTPATDAVDTFAPNAMVEVADLTAWRWLLRSGTSGYRYDAIPPRTATGWAVHQEDWLYDSWSTDDRYVVGANEQVDDGSSSAYLVSRASDGATVVSWAVDAMHDAVWESGSRVLLQVRRGDGRFQWIRCAVPAGNCSRVGPATAGAYDGLLPATRRAS